MTKKAKLSETKNQDVLDFRNYLIEKKNYSGPYVAKIVADILVDYDNHFGIENTNSQ